MEMRTQLRGLVVVATMLATLVVLSAGLPTAHGKVEAGVVGLGNRKLLAEDKTTYSYTCSGNTFRYNIHRPWPASSSTPYVTTVSSSCGSITTTVSTRDAPFQSGSTTLPRAELRVLNDYGTGATRSISFEVMVDPTVYGVDIMQIFDGDVGRPTLQLKVSKDNGGTILYRSFTKASLDTEATLLTGIYGKFTRVRVVHNAGSNAFDLTAGNKSLRVRDNNNGAAKYYFKFGVYTATGDQNPSRTLKATFKNVKVY